jgi:polysaccharide export outer membrane protein
MVRRIKELVCGFACLVAFAGCGGAPAYNYKVEPDPRATEFTVGPLDQISVRVWKNLELSAEVTVRPDGVVTLPLIGDVRAGGRTPTEIQKEVAKRLGDFVRDEELVVSVGVTSVNSYSFTVLGAVEHSGYFTAKSYVTTVEAIAMAGGPNRFAGNTAYIVRGKPARRIPIDLRRATSSEYAAENLVVLRGDLIVIP